MAGGGALAAIRESARKFLKGDSNEPRNKLKRKIRHLPAADQASDSQLAGVAQQPPVDTVEHRNPQILGEPHPQTIHYRYPAGPRELGALRTNQLPIAPFAEPNNAAMGLGWSRPMYDATVHIPARGPLDYNLNPNEVRHVEGTNGYYAPGTEGQAYGAPQVNDWQDYGAPQVNGWQNDDPPHANGWRNYDPPQANGWRGYDDSRANGWYDQRNVPQAVPNRRPLPNGHGKRPQARNYWSGPPTGSGPKTSIPGSHQVPHRRYGRAAHRNSSMSHDDPEPGPSNWRKRYKGKGKRVFSGRAGSQTGHGIWDPHTDSPPYEPSDASVDDPGRNPASRNTEYSAVLGRYTDEDAASRRAQASSQSDSVDYDKACPIERAKRQTYPGKHRRHVLLANGKMRSAVAHAEPMDEPQFSRKNYYNRGGEGKVFVAKLKGGKETIAVKRIAKPSKGGIPAEWISLRQIPEKHRNILQWVGIFYQKGFHCPWNIMTEFCGGGDLYAFKNHWSDIGRPVPRAFYYHLASSMAQALAFLHAGLYYPSNVDFFDGELRHMVYKPLADKPIIHRDIKLENIFIRFNHNNKYGLPDLVLGDFGLACAAEESVEYPGTPGYFPPEVVDVLVYAKRVGDVRQVIRSELNRRREITGRRLMTPASDVYCLGACFFYLLADFEELHEWRVITPSEIRERITWDSCLQYPIEDCLHEDPEQRITTETLFYLASVWERKLALKHRNNTIGSDDSWWPFTGESEEMRRRNRFGGGRNPTTPPQPPPPSSGGQPPPRGGHDAGDRFDRRHNKSPPPPPPSEGPDPMSWHVETRQQQVQEPEEHYVHGALNNEPTQALSQERGFRQLGSIGAGHPGPAAAAPAPAAQAAPPAPAAQAAPLPNPYDPYAASPYAQQPYNAQPYQPQVQQNLQHVGGQVQFGQSSFPVAPPALQHPALRNQAQAPAQYAPPPSVGQVRYKFDNAQQQRQLYQRQQHQQYHQQPQQQPRQHQRSPPPQQPWLPGLGDPGYGPSGANMHGPAPLPPAGPQDVRPPPGLGYSEQHWKTTEINQAQNQQQLGLVMPPGPNYARLPAEINVAQGNPQHPVGPKGILANAPPQPHVDRAPFGKSFTAQQAPFPQQQQQAPHKAQQLKYNLQRIQGELQSQPPFLPFAVLDKRFDFVNDAARKDGVKPQKSIPQKRTQFDAGSQPPPKRVQRASLMGSTPFSV